MAPHAVAFHVYDIPFHMPFLLIAVLMVTMALAIAFWPLWGARLRREGTSGRPEPVPSPDDGVIEALRQQRREIEAEFVQGRLTEEAREQALDELAQRMAAETRSPEALSSDAPPAAPQSAWGLGIGMAVFVIAVVSGGYSLLGMRATPTSPAQTGTEAAAPEIGDAQLTAMVAELARKMEERPDDPNGWALLARSQAAIGQAEQAAKAFERAVSLAPQDASLLADYADFSVAMQNGNFAGKPYALVQRALKANPHEPKALAIAGVAEMRLGNKLTARTHWQKLRKLLPADSPDLAQIDAILAQLDGTPAARAAPSSTAELRGTVSLAAALAGKADRNAVFFIIARAASDDAAAPAPRMPLAVARLPLPDKWPHVFSLTDAMAMSPEMRLSSFKKVTIEARISRSGQAQRQSGDLFGMIGPVAADARDVGVTIDRIAP